MLIAAKTDTGMTRKANEDSFFVSSGEVTYIAVADGMGGLKAGKLASSTAISEVDKVLSKVKTKHKDIPALLTTALTKANDKVYSLTQKEPDGEGMGTTFVMAYIDGSKAYFANIGDSRAYLISGDEISQITIDHSVVQQLYERGEIKRSEMRTHPRKNLITRAIGTNDSVECDVFEKDLFAGDLILLCSDGLNNMVEDEQILDIYNKYTDLDEFADALVKTANDAGGYDNITVVALKFQGSEV